MRRRICAALLSLACGVGVDSALAEGPPPAAGADALAAARSAWVLKHFKEAESLYKSALDHGGLAPADTLDAYVHLGAARAALGRTDLARAAFRQAAFIDAHFQVPALPPVASRRAHKVASLARRDEAKLGSIRLNATFPQSVPAGTPLSINATLDARHAGVIARIGIDAHDPLSDRHYALTDVAAPKVHFDIPVDVALPGASLLIRIDALDPHDNRLASREGHVQVEGAPPPKVVVLPPPPPLVDTTAPATFTFNIDPIPTSKEHGGTHHGFWSSPWPYVIGGALLAAGGAVAFYELHPTDEVSLGAARVTTR